MARLCPECGAENADNLICQKCGARLPLPARNGPLRDIIAFSYVAPLYSKPIYLYDEEGGLADVRVEFRLYKAYREPKQPPIIIYDRDGYVNPKQLEYSLVRLEPAELEQLKDAVDRALWRELAGRKERGSKSSHPVEGLWEAGRLVTPVPRLRSVDFLRGFDWRDLVEEIINFKKVVMDERLKLVRLTHAMRGLRQSINPHALVVLPGQTGKSEWYRHVGVLEDKVGANSLVGYADADGPKPGSVDGSELPFALDQIESSGMYLIFRYMLGLMEAGEARIDMAAYPFMIRSLSPFAILSNPLGDPKSNFGLLLEKLCRNPALGRRFGIILYDKNAKRLEKREREFEALREKVQLFRAAEEYALPELKRVISDELVWDWLNTRNEEFTSQALKLIEPLNTADSENLYFFLREFIENGVAHTRGGALRASLAMNLDAVALKNYTIEDLLTEAEDYLHDLLKINYESIQNITASFKEAKDEAALRSFDMLPGYMKEIVSAAELWRRSLSEEERRQITIPHQHYLSSIPYIPQSAKYFSQVLLVARRGNPERYNETLKEHFGLEIKKGAGELVMWIYDLTPNPKLRVLGNLYNLDILANSGEYENSFGGGREAPSTQENMPPPKLAKMSKLPKMSKGQVENPPTPIEEAEAQTPTHGTSVTSVTCVTGSPRSLGEDEKRLLAIMMRGATYTTAEVAAKAGWAVEHAERVLKLAERDGLVFQPSPGKWMLAI